MMETQKPPSLSAQGVLLILTWLLTGIVLLLASALRPRWLAKPKLAVRISLLACALILLPFVPGVFMPRQRFGSYVVLAIVSLASLAHDIWTCVSRAKR